MNEISSKIVSLSGLKELEKTDFNQINEWKENEYKKIRSDLKLILERQKVNQKDLRLAKRNSELRKLNKKTNPAIRGTCLRIKSDRKTPSSKGCFKLKFLVVLLNKN